MRNELSNFFAGKSVCVTGGAGFIGSHTVGALLEAGATVSVIDNLERGSRESIDRLAGPVDLVIGDARDLELCKGLFTGSDVVMHLASKVGGIGYYLSHPYEVLDANLSMDQTVLRAVIEAKVPYYFYASSTHVYPKELQDTPDCAAITERQDLPASPELSYGWAKLLGERIIMSAVDEGCAPRTAVARIMGAYGPGQDTDLDTGSAIPVFIRRAIEYPELKPFTVKGTGRETRGFCFVEDVVEGLLLSIAKLNDHDLVGPVNIGAEETVSIGELAQTIVDISGKEIEICYDTTHETVIWGQAVDCSLARELLGGWQPSTSLRTGLERSYEWIASRLPNGGK